MAVKFEGFVNGKWGEPDPGEETNPIFAGVETHSFKWGGDPDTYPNELSFVVNETLKKKLTKKKINVVMVGGLRQTQ